jgi:hypothetical protein
MTSVTLVSWAMLPTSVVLQSEESVRLCRNGCEEGRQPKGEEEVFLSQKTQLCFSNLCQNFISCISSACLVLVMLHWSFV